MQISPRTVFRILADYQRVSGVPETVLSAMEAEGLDPAKRKNAPLLEQITEVLGDDPMPEEARELVRHTTASPKLQKRKDPMSEDERIVTGLRQDLRRWLSNVPDNDHKGDLLEQALAEESFEFWGDCDLSRRCPFDRNQRS